MRFEIVLFVITAFLMANVYSDGAYFKKLLTWKKYYKMAGIAFGAFMLYWLFRKNPGKAQQIVCASNEYLKYLPVDKNTSMMMSPILDFTAKNGFSSNLDVKYPVTAMPQVRPHLSQYEQITQSGKRGTKRSVSETKKKFVAASQKWCCGKCGRQLPAWFEVDHKTRLEYGGSNHVDNLIALCRDCHGEKTAMENL